MKTAEKLFATCLKCLTIFDRTQEKGLLNASLIVAKSTLKSEIEISITFLVKIGKDITYFIAEKNEISILIKFES